MAQNFQNLVKQPPKSWPCSPKVKLIEYFLRILVLYWNHEIRKLGESLRTNVIKVENENLLNNHIIGNEISRAESGAKMKLIYGVCRNMYSIAH